MKFYNEIRLVSIDFREHPTSDRDLVGEVWKMSVAEQLHST